MTGTMTVQLPNSSADHRVTVYAHGLVYASCCVAEGTTVEAIVAAVDRQYPTGLDHGWSISTDLTFATGEPNPHVCESDPSRRHYLLNC